MLTNKIIKTEKHLEGKLGENGDNAGSHNFQTASCTLSDEVLGGLRGLNGAILLLQKARNDLLRQVWLLIICHCNCFEPQVGMSAAGGVDSAKEGEETIVGKCYKPGCLRRAAHKCRGCLQV